MTATAAAVAPATRPDTDPAEGDKKDLWICWWIQPIFYMLFGLMFVPLGRIMPPPPPGASPQQIVAFFHDHSLGIKIGFAMLMLVIGFGSIANGLVAFQMKRMSVKPIFAYGYIATLAVGALPGCLFAGFCFLVATFRPDRDPHLLALLYDMALLTFVGSLGCFSTQYLILAIAILLDRNKIFPHWFGYVSIWQIVTELLAVPVFVFKDGPFAWDGAISFWQGTIVFVVYQVCLIWLLRKAIQRQDPAVPVQD